MQPRKDLAGPRPPGNRSGSPPLRPASPDRTLTAGARPTAILRWHERRFAGERAGPPAGPARSAVGTSASQQCGLGMILLANSGRPRAVVNVPYCLTPPNVLPFVICPNSQTQVPPTLACVQYG